jgi:hypothetical protein
MNWKPKLELKKLGMEGMSNQGYSNHSSQREAEASVRIPHEAPFCSNLKTSFVLQMLTIAQDIALLVLIMVLFCISPAGAVAQLLLISCCFSSAKVATQVPAQSSLPSTLWMSLGKNSVEPIVAR